MRIAILSGGTGWHVQDLIRAAAGLGHSAVAVDFRRVWATVGPLTLPSPPGERERKVPAPSLPSPPGERVAEGRVRGHEHPGGPLAGFDAAVVRTMPAGSLEQV